MHFILFRQSSIVSLFRVIACIYTFVALVPPHPVATWTYFTSQMLSTVSFSLRIYSRLLAVDQCFSTGVPRNFRVPRMAAGGKGVRKGCVCVELTPPFELDIFRKRITCAKEINCFRTLFAC